MAGRIAYYGNIVKDGLVLCLDAAKRDSYPGNGTVWSDISGFQNNGTLTNGPTYNSANGGSIVFDGINDYIQCSAVTSFISAATRFTISFWGFPNAINRFLSIGYFISSANRINVGPWNDGNIYFNVGGNAFGLTSYVANQWQNFTMTFDGSQTGNQNRLQGYINGNIQTLTYVGTIPSISGTITDFFIGYLDSFSSYADGRIATVQIYNRALTASEVLQNYNATKGRYGL